MTTVKRVQTQRGQSPYKPGGRARMDETYILVKGQWVYLYRAVDKSGETIDFVLTKYRNKKAVKRFLKKIIKHNGKPGLINIDKSSANFCEEKDAAGHGF